MSREATLLSVDGEGPNGTFVTVQYAEDDRAQQQQLVVGRVDALVDIQTLIRKTVYIDHQGIGKPVVLRSRRT